MSFESPISGEQWLVSRTVLTTNTAQDEAEAIDRSNILGRTGQGRELRDAKPQAASGYNEGPTEDELPDEAFATGQSSTGRVI